MREAGRRDRAAIILVAARLIRVDREIHASDIGAAIDCEVSDPIVSHAKSEGLKSLISMVAHKACM